MSKPPRKPLRWVGSAKRDLDAMPEDVKDVFGHAIDLAQAGGRHQDAKVMAGFGSAGVLELVEDSRGDTYPRRLYGEVRRLGLRAALLPEEVQERHQDPQRGRGLDPRKTEGSEAGLRSLAS
jgi:hypothetical protein